MPAARMSAQAVPQNPPGAPAPGAQGPRALLDAEQRQNAGITCRDVCWLFCCPPWPSSIAAKLAFVPPEASYKFVPVVTPGECEASSASVGGSGPRERFRIVLNDPLDWHFVPSQLEAVEAFYARSAKGQQIACMYMRSCSPEARFTMLFSHGNAVDLGQMCSFYWALGKRLGVNIFSYDYSGYGVSTGTPSEKNVYADVEAAWRELQTRYGIKAENVILYGQSIGTVAAVDLAAKERFGGVILHGTLASGLRVAFPETRRNWFFDVFKSIDKAERIHSRTLVIHGSEDEVIPVAHGISIYERLPAAVDPLFIEGAGHNDVELFAQYYDRLKRFINDELRQAPLDAPGPAAPEVLPTL
ncbi:alpha/beta hydrolase domain-containing protein 17C-like [Paramacrobiotus metropolitanus]|uniref:alpha/beta hydrolase domain-containing protein 17C-like n=1 Tax=Paramacrobiotus metropolitanus TaxID=2943436 RepID=UPI0024462981|nr:alpha/beta hydrolase domain-containing protein 17C-like [Paramacrobiotus metropolitanus]XP_055344342.1 alpha/beta hydrolase domain-containing protein 17C-like [Paramacrobiotus metropolitanus]